MSNRISNDTQFTMDYSILNKTETHKMKLKEGGNIDVIIENKSGRIDILAFKKVIIKIISLNTLIVPINLNG